MAIVDPIVDPILDPARLNLRIDASRTGYTAYSATVKEREQTYLRVSSPPFRQFLHAGGKLLAYGEHDQWPEEVGPGDVEHTRSSFNVAQAVPEIWASLEADRKFPKVRFVEEMLLPPPPNFNDQEETARREQAYAAEKLVARAKASLREQVLANYIRRAKMGPHYYRTILHKNRSGHAWMRVLPVVKIVDGVAERQGHGAFLVQSRIDNSIVFPIFSDAIEGANLDSVLVVTRRSAWKVNAEYPVAKDGTPTVVLDQNGLTAVSASFYQPTDYPADESGYRNVWVEDYWLNDPTYSKATNSGEPVSGRVINALRMNGKIVRVTEYPGWTSVPYFHIQNDNGRDRLGKSDVGNVQPFQDAYNRLLSEQQDVIHGGSRPKYTYETEAGGDLQLDDEGVIRLQPDEKLAQLQTSINVFPTQVQHQILQTLQDRSTGLNPTAWGEIPRVASGRAMAAAAKATSGRRIPRLVDDEEFIQAVLTFMLDCMELYGWDASDQLYAGNRDFEIDFPNEDPRDPNEITLDVINRLNAKLIDFATAMEELGVSSPDEMLEKVRRDLGDPILHPEAAQAAAMLQRLIQSMQLEQQKAQQEALMAAQAGAGQGQPGSTVNAQQGQVNAAQAQAQQQAQPTLGPGQNAPASQPGVPNQGQAPADLSTMLQDGKVGNRMIVGSKA